MRQVTIMAAAILTLFGASFAQAEGRAAPGVVAPDSPRLLRDGEVEPAPAMRANGGVGEQEVPFDGAQTRSGGPVGGNKTQQE